MLIPCCGFEVSSVPVMPYVVILGPICSNALAHGAIQRKQLLLLMSACDCAGFSGQLYSEKFWLLKTGGGWTVRKETLQAPLCGRPISPHLTLLRVFLMSRFLPYIRMPGTLNYLTLKVSFHLGQFSAVCVYIRSHSEFPGVGTSVYNFGRDTVEPITDHVSLDSAGLTETARLVRESSINQKHNSEVIEFSSLSGPRHVMVLMSIVSTLCVTQCNIV